MSKASYSGANVTIGVDTFASWITMTNKLIYDMSTVVMTTEANTAGATTSGNAVINGVFAATTMVALTALRGGNVTTSGNLSVSSNIVIAGNAFVTGSTTVNALSIGGALVANAGVTLGPNVSITNALTANQATITGVKNFGALSSLVFTETANASNNGKFLKQTANTLGLSTIALDDLSDANVGSPSTDQFLKYNGTEWVPAAITSGGSFGSNSISANNLSSDYNALFGALTLLGNTGFAVNVAVNSTVSAISFKANTITFANTDLITVGAVSKLRITGGANNQFLQLSNSASGAVAWTTVNADFVFPNSAVTTLGANVLSVDRTNGRVGVGTNAVPTSYVFGVGGNTYANGDVFVTGNVSAVGISATTFTGALTGLASNALALNGKADTFFANATNLTTGTLPAARLPFSMDQAVATTSNVTYNIVTATGFMPSANGAAFGNTLRRSEVFGNTGNFAGGITVSADSDFGNTTISGMRIRGYKEFVTTIGSVATNAVTVNLANGNIFDVTLANSSIAVTFANPPSSGNAYSITMIVRQDVNGSRVLTWPAAVKWPNGSAPPLTNTASAVDVLSFFTVDGGSNFFGALSLGNLS